MKTCRFIILAAATMLAACASAGLSACATTANEDVSPVPPPPAPIPAPSDDSGTPADADAGAPCTTDCEYFPPACSADILCPNGLFDLAKPLGGPEHFDGRTTIHLVRGRSEKDVWVVGALGALTRFDGTSWVRSELPIPSESPRGRVPTLRTLWLRDDYEVGIAGFDQVYSRGLVAAPDAGADAGDWTAHGAAAIAPKPPFSAARQAVIYGWGAPDSEWFWLTTWRLSSNTTSPTGLVRVRLTAPSVFKGEVAAMGVGTFASIHGASADDLWAVGMDGATVHVSNANGASPSVQAYNSQTRNALYGVWAASESDVWAVGFGGTIRHYVGGPLLWEVVLGISEELSLNAVWGSSSSDIWAVGKDAVVLHYDGTGWSRAKIGGLGSRRPNLTTVWTSGRGHVWVGGEGVVLSLGGKP
ncbi:MAG: hypothetical protein K0S65_6227 [Labilithrix sp.]|nr:hypothetical protein [Labilithrix sp.]